MYSRSYAVLAAAAVALATGAAAYWYWSPFLTLYALKSSAESRDAEAFNARVDYPRLRESIKGQLAEYLASTTQRSDRAAAASGRAGAALGALFGTLFADKLVDSLVRPEVVMRLMNEARIEVPSSPRGDTPSNAGSAAGSGETAAEPDKRKLDWVTQRASLDRIVVYLGERDQPSDRRVGAALERSGFATWKLTEVRLPRRSFGR